MIHMWFYLYIILFVVYLLGSHHMGLEVRKPVFWGFVNNKDADQPVHPHSTISAFVIRLLESIISKLATSEILNF